MTDSIIGALRDYFLACPLTGDRRVDVDNLHTREMAFDVGTTPADEILQRYISGSCLKQYVFQVSAAYPLKDESAQNVADAALFEQLAAWLSAQTKARDFPRLPPACQARQIEAISSGYFEGMDAKTRIYAIQCRIVYFKKGVR